MPWLILAHRGSQNRKFIQVHSEVLKVFECSVLLQSPKGLQLTERGEVLLSLHMSHVSSVCYHIYHVAWCFLSALVISVQLELRWLFLPPLFPAALHTIWDTLGSQCPETMP